MELILGIDSNPVWPAYDRPLTDNEIDLIHEEQSEYMNLMVKNGYSIYVNEIKYKTDDFYNILQLVGKKHRLSFDIYFKYTKKELDQFKAFVFDCTASIAMKNDITYWSKYRNLNEKEKFVNPDAKYPVKFNRKCGVRGNVKFKPDKFIICSQSSTCVPINIKEKIVNSDLTGYYFEKIVNLTKNTTEEAYSLTATKLMPNRIIDKLHTETNNGLRRDGHIIYNQGVLENINDFNYAAESSYKEDGHADMIVSQNMRQFYLNNKLKSGLFEPVLELGTDSFEEYNKTIISLALDIQRYNENHVIGHEKINPSTLISGVI
jgi:hypothetical protein